MANSVSELEAQIVAYRHAIKDVVREPDPVKLREALAKLLSEDGMGLLGRDLHLVIKHAVQLVQLGEGEMSREAMQDYQDKLMDLTKAVKALAKGATVDSWLKA